jgi:hypothetical protein
VIVEVLVPSAATPLGLADGTSASTITMQARDANGNNLTTGGLTVTMSANGSATLSAVSDNADGTYTATITNSTVETVTVSAAFAENAPTTGTGVKFTSAVSSTLEPPKAALTVTVSTVLLVIVAVCQPNQYYCR